MKPILKYPYFLSEATRNLDIASDEFYVQALNEINEEAFICATELVGPNSVEYEDLYEVILQELEDLVLEFIAYHC